MGYFLVSAGALFYKSSFLDPWGQISRWLGPSCETCFGIMKVLVLRILDCLCRAIQVRSALSWVRHRLVRECLCWVQCVRLKNRTNRLVDVSRSMIVFLFLAVHGLFLMFLSIILLIITTTSIASRRAVAYAPSSTLIELWVLIKPIFSIILAIIWSAYSLSTLLTRLTITFILHWQLIWYIIVLLLIGCLIARHFLTLDRFHMLLLRCKRVVAIVMRMHNSLDKILAIIAYQVCLS